MLTRIEHAWTRIQSIRSGRPLAEQLAIVALLALVSGAFLSSGWTAAGHGSRAVALVLALVLLGVLLAVIANSGNEIVITQCRARARDAERACLIEQNADLRRQVEESQHRLVEIQDMVLRRVGVELHDGPAQLVSLALLRLDGLVLEKTPPDGTRQQNDDGQIRSALQEALAEIRSMASGLMLPELSGISTGDVLRLAARNHERRTATSVACDVDELPQRAPGPVKTCLYRFAQEALNNAYRHAGGRGQAIRGSCRGDTMEIEVADAGPGFAAGAIASAGHLGLLGMRERIASLGGTLVIDSRPGAGTRLTARFKLAHGSE